MTHLKLKGFAQPRFAAAFFLFALGSGSAMAERGVVVVDSADTIAIFETDTNTVVGTVATGSGGAAETDCAISDDGKTAYVTLPRSQKLLPIDIQGAGIVGTPIPLSIAAQAVNLSHDGKYAVLTSRFGGTRVSAVNLATRTEVSVLDTVGTSNHDICDDGRILGARYLSGVQRLAISATGVLSVDSGLVGPSSGYNLVCAKGSKTFLTTDPDSGNVFSHDIATLRRISFIGRGDASGWIAFNKDSSIGFLRTQGARLSAFRYNPDDGSFGPTIWGAEGVGSFGVRGVNDSEIFSHQMAVSKAGNLYVPGDGVVSVVNPETGASIARIPIDGRTAGICFSRGTATPERVLVPSTVSNPSTSLDTAAVPGGPAGSYRISAKFCSTSASNFGNLLHTVRQLSNNNNLLSRSVDAPSGPPGGEGAVQTLEQNTGYADGVLSNGECVGTLNVIGLSDRKRFTFLVDFTGNAAP